MSIPSSQIETWSNQGAKVTSDNTFKSVKAALEHADSPIAAMIASGRVKIDLQGSYAHDTNIHGDSDVDILVRYTNCFHSNKMSLPSEQYQLHEQHYVAATYDWDDFQRDVIAALDKYYTAAMVDKTGNKSLKVLPSSARLRADVVPVIDHREYAYFWGPALHSKEEGVALKHKSTGAFIVNYPEQHYMNATAKENATGKQYKNLVRIIKNMRSYLVDKGRLTKDEAPSYFVQGMIYNVPNDIFVDDKATTHA